jgi:hypothetical protein
VKQQNDEKANSYKQLLLEMVNEGRVPHEGVSDIEDSRFLKSDGKDEGKPQVEVKQQQTPPNQISGTAEVGTGGSGGGGWGGGRSGWYHG